MRKTKSLVFTNKNFTTSAMDHSHLQDPPVLTSNYHKPSLPSSQNLPRIQPDGCRSSTWTVLQENALPETTFPLLIDPTAALSPFPYKIIRTLCKADYSKVKLAENIITGTKVAIKILDSKATRISMSIIQVGMREVDVLKSISHPNIVQFFDYCIDDSNIYIVTEYVDGCELLAYVTDMIQLSERVTRKIMKLLVSAVDYLHSQDIVHRDLKLENVMVVEKNGKINIKLIDFGFSRVAGMNDLLSTRCGSEEYVAPEIIKGEKYDGKLSDVWSLGVILYSCLFGCFPFNPEEGPLAKLFYKICTLSYKIPPHSVSPQCENVIKKIFVADPMQRISCLQILSHDWFDTEN